LPCPFCGGKAECNGGPDWNFGMAIICPKCTGTRFFNEQKAIEHWNRRYTYENLGVKKEIITMS